MENKFFYPRMELFLLRLWADESADGKTSLWIMHVPTGEQALLTGLDELKTFITRHGGSTPVTDRPFNGHLR